MKLDHHRNGVSKFINIERLSLLSSEDQQQYWTYAFSVILFSFLSGSFMNLVGYDFHNVLSITFFTFDLVFYLFFIYFFVRLLVIEKKHQVFKKRKYVTLLNLPYFLLSIAFSIVPIFTSETTIYVDGSFSIHVFGGYYIFIYIPLFFILLNLSYYAYLDCFKDFKTRQQSTIKLPFLSRP